jgi:hypothetical protein
MPINGHPNKITRIPPKKNNDAFTLCFWKKNLNVLSIPIINVRPVTNNNYKKKKFVKFFFFFFQKQKGGLFDFFFFEKKNHNPLTNDQKIL